MLSHTNIDEDNLTAIKVLFNFMVRLKRFFVYNRKDLFTECIEDDNKVLGTDIVGEMEYLKCTSHELMEDLVRGKQGVQKSEYDEFYETVVDSSLDLEKEKLSEYLSNVET